MTFAALTIDVNARLANLEAGLAKTEQHLGKLAGKAQAASSTINSAFAAIGVGALLTSAIGKANQLVDEMASLDDAAESVGSTVESVSESFNKWRIGGGTIQELTAATSKLVKSMQGADEESKGAGEAFAALGIKTRDASGNLRDSITVLNEVAAKLNEYADGANKTAIAQALFGKSGADLLPKLKDLATETSSLGRITGEQAAQAEEFQKALRRIGVEADFAKQQLLAQYIPAITELIRKYNEARRAGLDFVESLKLSSGLSANNPEKELDTYEKKLESVNKTLSEMSQLGPFTRRLNNALFADEATLTEQQRVFGARVEQLRIIVGLRKQEALLAQSQSERDALGAGALGKDGAPALTGEKKVDKTKQTISEAQKLLEQLNEQLTKLETPSLEKQILAKIGRGEIEGINATLEQQILLQAQLIDGEKKRADIIKEATAEETADYEAVARLNKQAASDLQKEVQAIEAAINPTKKWNDELARVSELVEQGSISLETANARRAQILQEKDAFLEGTDNRVKELDDSAKELGLTFASAFEDAVIEGKNFREVLAGIAKDVARIYLRNQFTKPLANYIGGSGDWQNSVFGGLLGGVGRLFGGGGGTAAQVLSDSEELGGMVGKSGAQITIVNRYDMKNSALTQQFVEQAANLGTARALSTITDSRARGSLVFA